MLSLWLKLGLPLSGCFYSLGNDCKGPRPILPCLPVAGKHPYSIDRCERRDLFDLLASNFNQRTKPTIMLMIITETIIMLAIAITLTAVIAVPRWVPFAYSSALPSLPNVPTGYRVNLLPGALEICARLGTPEEVSQSG